MGPVRRREVIDLRYLALIGCPKPVDDRTWSLIGREDYDRVGATATVRLLPTEEDLVYVKHRDNKFLLLQK